MSVYSKKAIKEKFKSAITDYMSKFQIKTIDNNFWTQIYTLMWDEFPHIITLSSDGMYLNTAIDDYLNDDSDEYTNDNNPHFCNFEHICVQNTLMNIIEAYNNAIVYRNEDYPVIIGDHMLVFMHQTENSSDIYILQSTPNLTKKFIRCIMESESINEAEYTYILENEGTFDDVCLTIKEEDIENVNIDMNYNDDLPHDKICSFLKSSETGIVLLHGDPGTGKSAYIKYLINEIRGRHFIVINANTLQMIPTTTLAQLFLSDSDNVIIIEDNAINKNNINKNEQIKSIIGIENSLAFSTKVPYKVIFVFNDAAYNYNKDKVPESKIKIDYKFGNLSPEKTKNLCIDYNIDFKDGETMPLSKIIGGDNDDKYDQTVNKHNKIGF
ncbi:MAG: hypothetical protein [Wendovervirus sonii]|uniref:AAA family ATPase n=1 Tax=phage Lak_Megaphage_Sonny TaxID=3109229 RepID=A0ABZ0Z685_9CAUD|nr:MAG: hypothetical protein [phage Lak_Megaphage_Sonny]